MNSYFQKTKTISFVILLLITISTSKAFGQNIDSIAALDFDELYEKGIDYFNKEEYSTSLTYLQQAAIKNQNDSQLATYLGITCENLNLYGIGITYFEASLHIYESKRSFNNLGAIYADLGIYDISLEYIDKALSIDPFYSHALNNKGSIFVDLGKYDEALEILNKSIESTDTPLPQSYSNIGEAYQKMGQSENAILYFDKALSADSTLAETMILKVKELKKLGKPEKDYKSLCQEVIKIENNILAKNSQSYKDLFYRASAYHYLNENNLMVDDLYQALSILDNLTPVYPKASALFEFKGQIYAMLEDVDEAIENYKIVLSLEPENIRAKEYLENQ